MDEALDRFKQIAANSGSMYESMASRENEDDATDEWWW